MKNKTVQGFLLIIALAGVVLVVMGFLGSTEQYAPISATTLTDQVMPPITSLAKCETSQSNITTSTWTTFKNANWEFTFRYPQGWKIEEGKDFAGRSYLAISGDGYSIAFHRDFSSGLLFEDGMYKFCSRVIAGQNVQMAEDSKMAPSSDFALRYVFYIRHTHSYGVVILTPSQSSEVIDAFLNTLDWE